MSRSPFEPSPEQVARADLIIALQRLPWSAQAPAEFPLSGLVPTATWINAITEWVVEFRQVLITVSDTHTDMEAELHQLRIQREAIRTFLGTTGRA